MRAGRSGGASAGGARWRGLPDAEPTDAAAAHRGGEPAARRRVPAAAGRRVQRAPRHHLEAQQAVRVAGRVRFRPGIRVWVLCPDGSFIINLSVLNWIWFLLLLCFYTLFVPSSF